MTTPAQTARDSQSVSAKKPATPMMAQYFSIRENAGTDALIFYRMGDFYELFFEDAVKAAQALDIALTKRGKHEGEDIPMCGVPVHAAETYLQRLIKKGFRVAVCEQTEDPADAKKRGTKSVVKREIVRIVTPGTLTEDTLLDTRGANYIMSLFRSAVGDYALAWADISEGTFCTSEVGRDDLASEIMALTPRELIVADTMMSNLQNLPAIDLSAQALTVQPRATFDDRNGRARIESLFGVSTLDGFGDFSRAEMSAAGALINYLEITQAGRPANLTPPQKQITSGYMSIDPATRASLEIDRTQSGQHAGSLLSVIDQTVTGPGARLLRARLSRPLIHVDAIEMRLDDVAFFTKNTDLIKPLQSDLKMCGDPARALSRLSLDRGGPRDIQIIGDALITGHEISSRLFRHTQSGIPTNLSTIAEGLTLSDHPEIDVLARDIQAAFKPGAPITARDGGFVNPDWSADLDEARRLQKDGRKILAELQARYITLTGVPSLKIKHNNVLGYHIDITPKHADTMLSGTWEVDFIHRQTLVSALRFTTTELMDLDSRISRAGEQALALEQAIFKTFTARLRAFESHIRDRARYLAELDVSTANADWAVTSQSVRPKVDSSTAFAIENGRHPVVEHALRKNGDAAFTSNDCSLDATGQDAPRLVLITGPNMAGKSTYLRQNALMFILAQAGCFVPATRAHIGIADSVFSRVGASDDLSKGRSTFMTEMVETAAILNRAGPRSFVILDEIGRGTATFDGLSIAWATAEHLHMVNGSRALFATHYHELTDMIEGLDHASNASLRAKEWDGNLVFLHDVKPGAADKSYGVQVAKLAGLPDAAVDRARDVLGRLEQGHDGTRESLTHLPLFQTVTHRPAPEPSEIDRAVAAINPDDLSPREALNILYDLKRKTNTERRS